MSELAAAPTDLGTLRLSVRYDVGSGPIFVLLHGINADGEDWKPIIDTMGSGYRCIAVDLLGFGDSPKPTHIEYTADEHAQVLEQTLADLGVDEPFVLVGYSLGGDVAVRYASTYPQRLRRLFLLSTPFYLPEQYYERKNFSGQMIQAMMMRAAWRFLARGERDHTRVYELASGERLEPFAKQFLRTDDVPAHWEVMSKNLVNTISAATFVDDLPKLTMPTVFALGVRDPIVRPDQTLALQRIKPDLEIRRIVGLTADHFMLVALPERVAEEILRDEVTGLNVAWRGGSGEPLAILAGAEGSQPWLGIAETLSAKHDVAVIDLLGFGASAAPLTARYDLGDHVAPLRATVRELWGSRPVEVTGFGIGAAVALGFAAFAGDECSRVIALWPRVLVPGHSAEQSARSQRAAQTIAAQEQVAAIARDERARGVAGEALERRVIPLFKSLANVALSVDPAPLVARAKARVTLVLPTADEDAPRVWARTLAATGRIELEEPPGSAEDVFARPSTAIAAIDPSLAAAAVPVPSRSVRARLAPTLTDAMRSVDRRFIFRGLASLLLGLVLLSSFRFSALTLARGFSVWIAFSAVSTVLGAFGLRREKKTGWVPWVLVGGVGVALAAFMLLRDDVALRFFAWLVFGWVVWRAFADLFVASQATATPTPRWWLWLKGLGSAAIAIVIVIEPAAGGRLIRGLLGWYAAGSGVLLVSYGVQSWWRSTRRVGELLAPKAVQSLKVS